MPQATAMQAPSISPSEMVLDMVTTIMDTPKMDVHEKLAQLRELSVERITFDSPEQATKIISALADIISADPEPVVRVAALEAMERMIALEHKAEADLGKSPVDWTRVDLMMRQAKKKTDLDTAPVAQRAGAPSPEAPAILKVEAKPKASPKAASKSRAKVTQSVKPGSKAEIMQQMQESAVAAIKEANLPVVPPSAAMLGQIPKPDAPEPSEPVSPEPDSPEPKAGGSVLDAVAEVATGAVAAAVPSVTAPTPQVAHRPDDVPAPAHGAQASAHDEPPIMKFLRSVADTDDQDHIRELAARVISKIENMTALKAPPFPTPSPQE